jgi:hypothetical protein
MDDILASIRRILNEEEGAAGAATAEVPAAPAAAKPSAQAAAPAAAPAVAPPTPARTPNPDLEDEALTLSEDMLVSEPQATAGPPVTLSASATTPARAVAEPLPEIPAEPPPLLMPATVSRPPVAPPVEDSLLAPATAAAASASLGTLLRTVAAERSAAVSRGGPTIEDVVRDEIRPLLKEWLDQHLPPLVERLVRAEIERVVGRALP